MAIRVRRPKDKDELLDRIVDGDGNAFGARYEALTFCAALGYARESRIPFTDAGESIRWEQFHSVGGGALSSMLAVASSDDPEIVAPERIEDRIRVFEEYANGGLEELAGEIEKRPKMTPREVVLQLVLDAQQNDDDEKLPLDDIAEGLSS